MTILRFAPSPTGRIHIGNARTALLNWLFALKSGGQFLLRFDDTDVARSKQEYVEAIATDLAWLGITPARVEYQSKRFAEYDKAVEKLKAKGLLYACYESREELERRNKRLMSRPGPRIYDRAALKLTAEDKAELEAQVRKPHWRFLLDHKIVVWDDMVRGRQQVDTSSVSDPVLVRDDGSYLYTLPSVVDDIEFGITHVIRGEDHVVNAAVQMEITRALGAEPPHYAHHSLLIGSDGAGLSKRLGSLSITSIRESGLEPMAVNSLVALLGTSDAIHPVAHIQELVDGFDLSKLSRAPARFDETELRQLNAKLLHHLSWDDVRNRLGYGDEPFWKAVRGNITVLGDAKMWWDVIHADIMPNVGADDIAFVKASAEDLPVEPWGLETWKQWTTLVKAKTGRSGKALFMPLRQALTGLDHGPELAQLLPLLGRDKVLKRLSLQ